MNKYFIIIFIIISFIIGFSSGYFINGLLSNKNNQIVQPQQTIVYTAATFAPFFNNIKNFFPFNYTVVSGGSVLLAQRISQLNMSSDLYLTVDYTTIKNILIRANRAYWYLIIGTAPMVLAYNQNNTPPEVKHLINIAQLAQKNFSMWKDLFDYLVSGKVKVGFGDPNLDPEGYRGLMVLELAGMIFYNNQSYYVYKLFNVTKSYVLGQNAPSLYPQLTSGYVDVLFTYSYDAKSHGFSYILLPPQLNFGDPEYVNYYKQVKYVTSSNVTIQGDLIQVAVTIPSTAVNTNQAEQIIIFMMTDEGKEILSDYGLFTYFKFYGNINSVPLPLRYYLSPFM